MGAILAAGLGETVQLTSATLEGAGLAGLSPELRQRLIASLQRAFASGAVASGIAVVASFWLPHLDSSAQPSPVEQVSSEKTATLEPGASPVPAND